MADIYRHQNVKFADSGLQLRLPVDLVPPSQYSVLSNGLTTIEGTLRSRAGLVKLADVPWDGLAELLNVTYSTLHAGSGNPVINPIYVRIAVADSTGLVAITPESGPLSSGDSTYVNVHFPAYTGATNWYAFFGYSSNTYPFYQTWTEATIAGLGRVAVIDQLNPTIRPAGAIHTIFRLNQQNTAVSPERIVGIGQGLYSQQLPTGTFSEIDSATFDGNPLTIIPFRFDGDPNSWALVANSNAMRKRRRPSLYWQLGITPPASAVTASVGGAGAITGNNYDWRATYVYSVTNSESNPSPLNVTVGTQRPTANTNPDPISGGIPCTNPTNAYDNNPNTYAEFVGNSAAPNSMSCRFKSWASIGSVDGLTLNIDSEVIETGSTGSVTASIFYSTDNGTSWKTLYSTLVSRGRLTDSVTLPNGTDLTTLLVRAVAYGGDTAGGGGDTGGGGGSLPCPLSGAPTRLYGDPEWWFKNVEEEEDFIEITTTTGRKGTFSRKHRLYGDHGLLPLDRWEAGMYVFIDEPELHLEQVESIRSLHLPNATVDHYEATEGHVYSAWGFVGHNMKRSDTFDVGT